MTEIVDTLRNLWQTLYGTQDHDKLTAFIKELRDIKHDRFPERNNLDTTWYKDAVVYSTWYKDYCVPESGRV